MPKHAFGVDRISEDNSPEGRHKRAQDRDSLLLTATLRRVGRGDPVPVRIRNLSAGGLMAEHGPVLPVGAEVEIDLRGVGLVRGVVAWSTEGRVGIAFVEEIDPKAARKPVAVRTPEAKPLKRPL
ncbi:PilZ domain-containing protein [Sphingomonas desiccabilis]|uniref:PilZ domain-containing protein n=1 Tax=Sphingomonas desiccabilis TaxID=429134 RepID=UPI001C8630F9|nr:PilZ domain-containing protein [Sphingomonas desiccabilis]